jgi:hypothetical protein
MNFLKKLFNLTKKPLTEPKEQEPVFKGCRNWNHPDERIELCEHLNERGKCAIGNYRYTCAFVEPMAEYHYGELDPYRLTIADLEDEA